MPFQKTFTFCVLSAVMLGLFGCNSSSDSSDSTTTAATDVDDLNLTQIVTAYSHNSYDSDSERWPDEDIEQQLDGGIRVLEIDIYDTDGTVAHDDTTTNPHCSTVDLCLSQIDDWSLSHPNHVPITVFFELSDNEDKVTTDDDDDGTATLDERTQIKQGKMDVLVSALASYAADDRLVTYQESLEPVSELRGKLLISIFRKYNTPYYSDPSSYSGNQDLSITDALELTQDTETGEKYRQEMVDNDIFLGSRWLEANDYWENDDPDWAGIQALETAADLAGNMLRVLKQDDSDYTSDNITDNTYMVSTAADSEDPDASIESRANSLGTHTFEALREDTLVNEILDSDDKALPSCTQSGRADELDYCTTASE